MHSVLLCVSNLKLKNVFCLLLCPLFLLLLVWWITLLLSGHTEQNILVYIFTDMRTWCLCLTFIYVFLLIDSCFRNCRHLLWGTFFIKDVHHSCFKEYICVSIFYVFIFVLMIQMIGRVVHCKSNGKKHAKTFFFSSYIDSNC